MAQTHTVDVRSLLLTALVVAAASAIGAGSSLAGFLSSSLGADPGTAVETEHPRFLQRHVERPRTRDELSTPSVQRDVEHMLELQRRRIERLQSNRARAEEASLHGAAEDDGDPYHDPRAYFRAHRWCSRQGYTRSRLAYCIDTMVQTGVYSTEYDW